MSIQNEINPISLMTSYTTVRVPYDQTVENVSMPSKYSRAFFVYRHWPVKNWKKTKKEHRSNNARNASMFTTNRTIFERKKV